MVCHNQTGQLQGHQQQAQQPEQPQRQPHQHYCEAQGAVHRQTSMSSSSTQPMGWSIAVNAPSNAIWDQVEQKVNVEQSSQLDLGNYAGVNQLPIATSISGIGNYFSSTYNDAYRCVRGSDKYHFNYNYNYNYQQQQLQALQQINVASAVTFGNNDKNVEIGNNIGCNTNIPNHNIGMGMGLSNGGCARAGSNPSGSYGSTSNLMNQNYGCHYNGNNVSISNCNSNGCNNNNNVQLQSQREIGSGPSGDGDHEAGYGCTLHVSNNSGISGREDTYTGYDASSTASVITNTVLTNDATKSSVYIGGDDHDICGFGSQDNTNVIDINNNKYDQQSGAVIIDNEKQDTITSVNQCEASLQFDASPNENGISDLKSTPKSEPSLSENWDRETAFGVINNSRVTGLSSLGMQITKEKEVNDNFFNKDAESVRSMSPMRFEFQLQDELDFDQYVG